MTRRSGPVLAVALLIASTAVLGCSEAQPDDEVQAEPDVALRAGTPIELLERVALDGAWCILTVVADESEAALEGGDAHASQAFFEVRDGTTDGANLTVAVDWFGTRDQALDAVATAAPDLAALVGPDDTAPGTLGGRDGSATFGRTVTDFRGHQRGAFAAAVPLAEVVIRLTSFGVTTIADLASFERVAEGVIDGLTGDAEVRAVPPCGGWTRRDANI